MMQQNNTFIEQAIDILNEKDIRWHKVIGSLKSNDIDGIGASLEGLAYHNKFDAFKLIMSVYDNFGTLHIIRSFETAVVSNSIQFVEYFLEHYDFAAIIGNGVQFGSAKYTITDIYMPAVGRGHYDMVRLLLNRFSKNFDEISILEHAYVRKNLEMTNLILSNDDIRSRLSDNQINKYKNMLSVDEVIALNDISLIKDGCSSGGGCRNPTWRISNVLERAIELDNENIAKYLTQGLKNIGQRDVDILKKAISLNRLWYIEYIFEHSNIPLYSLILNELLEHAISENNKEIFNYLIANSNVDTLHFDSRKNKFTSGLIGYHKFVSTTNIQEVLSGLKLDDDWNIVETENAFLLMHTFDNVILRETIEVPFNNYLIRYETNNSKYNFEVIDVEYFEKYLNNKV